MKTDKMKSGERGECLAIDFLKPKGYKILMKNYKASYYEIDLISTKDNLLVFFEVKSRCSREYGNPEDFVSLQQKRSVRRAAEMYIEKFPWKGNIRFDIIAILPGEITHFKDAF